MIEKERVKYLNNHTVKGGKYILYWMQAARRNEYNHALEYAIKRANVTKKPLFVISAFSHFTPTPKED